MCRKCVYRPSFSILVTCLFRLQMQFGASMFSSAIWFSWVESMNAADGLREESQTRVTQVPPT